jgi:AcrR family transcriptional regulator
MTWLFSELSVLLTLALLLFVAAAALAPFEALGWWAGWDDGQPDDLATLPGIAQAASAAPADSYLVYLSGIATVDPLVVGYREGAFLDALDARLPRAAVIRDVFPYSVSNRPLTRERRTARFWRWLERTIDRYRLRPLYNVVMLRNLLQVAVSADRRYGPIYSYGVAREILLGLLRNGYRKGDQRPIILIALSGGAQIAVGSIPILRRVLGIPISVISIGGVLTSDSSIQMVEHVYQLSGSRDPVQHIGALLYPGRWPIFPRSAWNRYVAAGRLTVVDVGPMKHLGRGEYYTTSLTLPDGRRYVDAVADVAAEIVGSISARASAARGEQHGAP